MQKTEVNAQFGHQSTQILPRFILRQKIISHYLSGTEGTVIKVYILEACKL